MESQYFGAQGAFWFFIGLNQLAYMVPAIGTAAILQKKALLKGFVIGTSVTFILNACCFGLVGGPVTEGLRRRAVPARGWSDGSIRRPNRAGRRDAGSC